MADYIHANVLGSTSIKTYMWQFHNAVNARKGVPVFPEENLMVYLRPTKAEAISEIQESYNSIVRLFSLSYNPFIANGRYYIKTPGNIWMEHVTKLLKEIS